MGLPGEFQNIRVWDLGRRGQAHLVRWRVDGKDLSRSFPTKARADRARRRLLDALDSGEQFDTRSGLPASWVEAPVTLVAYAVGWHARNRASWAPKTRDVHRQALQHILAQAVDTATTGRLDAVRTWISDALSEGERAQTLDVERAGEWLAAHSLSLTELTPGYMRDTLLPMLGRNLDGSKAAAPTYNKRRTTLSAMLGDAFGDGLIAGHPMSGLRAKGTATSGQVDVRTIPSVADMRLLACATAAVGPEARRHLAFLAFTLFTGARPGEVSGLRVGDLDLPAEGWGEAVLSTSETRATSRSTGTAAAISKRGLKARSDDSTRVVPMPPELVALVRQHLELWPASADGAVFRSATGDLLSQNQSRLISKARTRLGWVGSHPFAAVTHYTGRHVYISALIRAGVDLTEIARLCGNSPAVILSTYAGVFASMRTETRSRIAEALKG